MNYDEYNREERQACCHLFRLLHEPIHEYLALREFLGSESVPQDFRIYSEVALIRDAYYARKPNVSEFMDQLTALIKQQEGVSDCRLYSELPPPLSNISETHPGQIRKKAGNDLSPQEMRVYGVMQGMFNAKPDLAICTGSDLVIYEAKLTLNFDNDQMERTKCIGMIWGQLLYRDLGFSEEPRVTVRKLGLHKSNPDISWERVAEIAKSLYPANDRTNMVLSLVARQGRLRKEDPLTPVGP